MNAVNGLTDIQNITIDRSLPVEHRARSLIKQLKTPYRFKHGKVVVHINFTGEKSLEDKIIEVYKNS